MRTDSEGLQSFIDRAKPKSFLGEEMKKSLVELKKALQEHEERHDFEVHVDTEGEAFAALNAAVMADAAEGGTRWVVHQGRLVRQEETLETQSPEQTLGVNAIETQTAADLPVPSDDEEVGEATGSLEASEKALDVDADVDTQAEVVEVAGAKSKSQPM